MDEFSSLFSLPQLYIDFNFQQLEDNHLDKKTFLRLQDGQYVVNKVITQGDVSIPIGYHGSKRFR